MFTIPGEGFAVGGLFRSGEASRAVVVGPTIGTGLAAGSVFSPSSLPAHEAGCAVVVTVTLPFAFP